MTGFGNSERERLPATDHDAAELPLLRVLLGSASGHAVMRLAGEIDRTTTGIVTDAVERCLRGRPARLTIDLRAVDFCDCAGVRTLRHAVLQANSAGATVHLTALTPAVHRIVTMVGAADLLGAVSAGAGDEPVAADSVRDAVSGVPPVLPPGPPPDAVSAARRQLNERYASGVERLLWEMDKEPIPDAEAIRRAITAAGQHETADVGPALVLLQAARLGLDRLEAEATDTARAAGVTDEALAALLGLPSADAAAAWRRWLAARKMLPYEDLPPEPPSVPGGAAHAAARAGHRAHVAAARITQIAERLEQLRSAADGGERSAEESEHAERSRAHAGEARILASEAAERATLGLLRAADALERSAASYEHLAWADTEREDEYRKEAAWYWRTAQEYRQLAREQYRQGAEDT